MNSDILIQQLTKKIAQKYIHELMFLANQIPLVDYTEEELLAESKQSRKFLGKWEYSLILFIRKMPVGFLMAYERMAENNDQYPKNSLYLGELVIHPNFQHLGYGKLLMQTFLDKSLQTKKFKYLSGKFLLSLQTNSASWNKKVQKFYESLGYTPRSTKQYDNRLDNIYELNPEKPRSLIN